MKNYCGFNINFLGLFLAVQFGRSGDKSAVYSETKEDQGSTSKQESGNSIKKGVSSFFGSKSSPSPDENLSHNPPLLDGKHDSLIWLEPNTKWDQFPLNQYSFSDANGEGFRQTNPTPHITYEELDRFVEIWKLYFGYRPVKASEMIEIIEAHECFDRMKGLIDKPSVKSVWLAKQVLTPFGGSHNIRNNHWWARGKEGRQVWWMLQTA